MKQKNLRFAALFCALALALVLSGCQRMAPPEQEGSTRIVTDCVGREVEIPSDPQWIAALDAFSGEVLVISGAGDKLASAPNGVRMDLILQEIYPPLADASVPMSGGTVNAESLLALSPDLALVQGRTIYANKDEVAKLDKMGIPYLVIQYTTMEEQIYAMELLGDILGGKPQERLEQLVDYYRDVIGRAESIAAAIPEEERLQIYHSINEITRTDGVDSLGKDWIECVGAIDVSAQAGFFSNDKGDYTASMEQIYAWDPDVIICSEVETADYIMTHDKWSGLWAVRENQVYNIPVGATRWGQRGSLETYFAILWLGRTLYPETYYKDVDLKQEVFNVYENILDFQLDDETYEKMLSGRGLRHASHYAGK